MAKRSTMGEKAGYGRLLDAWTAPDHCGPAIGCVATSFTFDATFFEEECLSRFLQMETSPEDRIGAYLVEHEERLSQLQCAAALVDQNHCRGERNLRWDLLPVRVPSAILHAKVSLLVWKSRVRLIIASANLTKDGYRRNREVFGVIDYHPNGDAPLDSLNQTLDFLDRVLRCCGEISPARQRCRDTLSWVRKNGKNWGRGRQRMPRAGVQVRPIFTGPGLPDFFSQIGGIWPWKAQPVHADVVSPFFDPPESANRPAQEIWKLLRQRGKVWVTYCTTVEDIPGRKKIRIHAPESLRDAAPDRLDCSTYFYRVRDKDENKEIRPLHAKILCLRSGLWNDPEKYGVHVIGSGNFTSAGTGLARHPNLEANLAYLEDKEHTPRIWNFLVEPFRAVKIFEDEADWIPVVSEDESAGNLATLPSSFGSAILDSLPNGSVQITLHITAGYKASWQLLMENEKSLFYDSARWQEAGCPADVPLPWASLHPPSGFWLRVEGRVGLAWWPVEIRSMEALPPPEELRNLSLDDLARILTSKRPVYRVLGKLLEKATGEAELSPEQSPELDPHKRVDTTGFLLQRTRRVSWALRALRERLERPIATANALEWRLRGVVGVESVANAICREGRTDEERAFLLAELALELDQVKPQVEPGGISARHVKQEVSKMIREIRKRIPRGALAGVGNLRKYVNSVFERIAK